MSMILNRRIPLAEQIPLLRASESLFGPDSKPRYRMIGIIVWKGDDDAEYGYARSLREAKAWAAKRLSADPSLEAEIEPFRASVHDYLLFDSLYGETGGYVFRDATALLEGDPSFQSVLRIGSDGSIEEE